MINDALQERPIGVHASIAEKLKELAELTHPPQIDLSLHDLLARTSLR